MLPSLCCERECCRTFAHPHQRKHILKLQSALNYPQFTAVLFEPWPHSFALQYFLHFIKPIDTLLRLMWLLSLAVLLFWRDIVRPKVAVFTDDYHVTST
jgi:hypothetical protein